MPGQFTYEQVFTPESHWFPGWSRETDRQRRAALLTFTIAGGGFAGVELAGAVNDFARGMLADYPHLTAADLQIILVHSRDRILPELSEPLARYALERMTARGVTFKLNERVADARPDACVLKTADEIQTKTLVWTAGTTPNPLIKTLPVAQDKRGAVIVDSTLAPDFALLPQRGDNLGARLDNALTHCLMDGYQKAVIMDSDSPTLPAAYLSQAFTALDKADVVLGPCEDGGYYLIGLNRPTPRLLREVQMSTPHVIRDTLNLAAEEGLTVTQLPVWYDVDTAVELERLQLELATLPAERATHTRRFLAICPNQSPD